MSRQAGRTPASAIPPITTHHNPVPEDFHAHLVGAFGIAIPHAFDQLCQRSIDLILDRSMVQRNLEKVIIPPLRRRELRIISLASISVVSLQYGQRNLSLKIMAKATRSL